MGKLVGGIFLLFVGLAVLFSLGADADSVKDVSTSEESVGTTLVKPKRGDIVVRISMVKPPKMRDYFDGMEVRLPAGLDVSPFEMIRYGNLGCQYSRGYVTGTTPNPGDLLVKDVLADGYDESTAKDIVYAARNAGMDTLCSHNIVKAK